MRIRNVAVFPQSEFLLNSSDDQHLRIFRIRMIVKSGMCYRKSVIQSIYYFIDSWVTLSS
jgi:hypothetical protein